MQSHPLYKITVTPKGILTNGLLLNKAYLASLSQEQLRYIIRAAELLAEVRKEDWAKPSQSLHYVSTLTKVHMMLALANPVYLDKYNFDPNQPRDRQGRWVEQGQVSSKTEEVSDRIAEFQVASSEGIRSDANTNSGKPNIANAIDLLQNNAEPKSTGYCARYVTKALRAGGFDIKAPRDGNAKNYGGSLKRAGFEPIAGSAHTDRQGTSYPPKGYIPQKGDVVIMDTYPASKNQAGHMAMYDGTQWISDWRQKSFWPGLSYRRYGPSYTIYRYPTP